MKIVGKMVGVVSTLAFLTACGGVEPQAGTYDVQVDIEVSEDGDGLTSRITLLDSMGEVAAEEEVEAFDGLSEYDVNQILKKIRVEVRLDGPPNIVPLPDPVKTMSQSLSSDGWGSFTGEVMAGLKPEMALEVTISLEAEGGQELYEMAYLPIHEARRAGMANQQETQAEDNLYDSNYELIRNAAQIGVATASQGQGE